MALERHFGYPGFRPGQEELVRAPLAGRDALGILPTGGGKSVCYQVPAACLPGVTVVVTPLVSLMADQVDRCRAAGISAELLNSTLPAEERAAARERIRQGRARVLFVAPERLETRSMRSLLAEIPVALLAVDEAHCISSWGHDFRPSYLALGAVRERLAAPVMALTATATPRVRAEIARVLRLRDPVTVVRSFDRPNLRWAVVQLGSRRDRVGALLRLLRSVEGAALVYGSSRKGVEGVRGRLAARGMAVEAYHAGLPGRERSRVQEVFMEAERPVVVATNAFGMGIDRADVRLVAHLELPGSLEGYYQEAGRAGRDGEMARCVALHVPGDGAVQEGFVERSHPRPRRVRKVERLLRRWIGPGGRGSIRLDQVSRAIKVQGAREEIRAALSALEKAGGIRILREDSSRGPEDEALEIGVLSRRGRLEGLRRHRRRERARLRAVRRYAGTRKCRRAFILEYFGEKASERSCGACDRCGFL